MDSLNFLGNPTPPAYAQVCQGVRWKTALGNTQNKEKGESLWVRIHIFRSR